MAKTTTGTIAATEHKIEEFAEDLGKMLGHARGKAEGWLSQRATIVKNLTQLRDEASALLSKLGHDAAVAGRRGRKAVNKAVSGMKRGPGRPRKGAEKIIFVGGKTKRIMSPEARLRISRAQKARWAKQKAGKK